MSTKLFIPKPCHEDWDKMSAAERGRHCQVCNKVVKDLTQLNKTEVIQVIANSKETNVCGRVNTEVLDKMPSKVPLFLQKAWRPAFQFLTFIGLMVADNKNVIAQEGFTTVGFIIPQTVETKPTHTKRKVNLEVKDELGDPIAYASIQITGINKKILAGQTDEKGKLSFSFTDDELGANEIIIAAACMGFERKEIRDVYLSKKEHNIGITLNSSTIIMPEFSIIAPKLILSGYTHTSGYIVTRNCRIEDPIIEEATDSTSTEETMSFNAFPNPTNGKVTINCNMDKTFEVQVFDNSGKMLMNIPNINVRKEVDLSSYADGIYYISIIQNELLIETKKVILVK